MVGDAFGTEFPAMKTNIFYYDEQSNALGVITGKNLSRVLGEDAGCLMLDT
jgi:hypothetical protein